MPWEQHVPADLQLRYEFHEKHHAAAILATEYPREWDEICQALRRFQITVAEIQKSGGSESEMPRKIAAVLRPLGWVEGRMHAEQSVDGEVVNQDTHFVDHLKGKVAFDFEWNSKDQTFDRDLFAFSEFFRFGKIAVGVIVTRSNDLDPLFVELGRITDRYGQERDLKAKFGASTTQMGKLLPRLRAGRNGGCPVLAVGIKRACVVDAPAAPTAPPPGQRRSRRGAT